MNTKFVSRDQADENHKVWNPEDIVTWFADGNPEALAEVMRPVAALLADRAEQVTDPRTVLLDLSHVVESLLSATLTLADAHELAKGNPIMCADVDIATTGLRAAVGALGAISENL